MGRCGLVLAVAAMGVLAGCGGKAPSGQVVATVDGKEITTSDLQLELQGASAPTPAAQQQLQAAALRSIVNRRVLADAAREEKLDKTPAFAIIQRKGEDLALIGALQQKIAASLPDIPPQDAQRFIDSHPDSFAQRKLFVVDQLIVSQAPQDVLVALRPLKTLAEVAALLDRRGVAYQRGVGAIDGGTSNPEMVTRIARLPAGEVFVVPAGGGFTANTVREARVEPLTGPVANELARNIMRQTRAQELIEKRFAQITTAAKDKVQYATGYAPPAAKPQQPATAP